MVSKFQSGMHGVFLTAAELTYRGFIVSLTSRNAFGADLLVTDKQRQRTWSVQVKTNQSTAANYWLLNRHCETLKIDSHVYVFVSLKRNQRPDFLVVPSRVVAEHVWKDHNKTAFGTRSAATQNGTTSRRVGKRRSAVDPGASRR